MQIVKDSKKVRQTIIIEGRMPNPYDVVIFDNVTDDMDGLFKVFRAQGSKVAHVTSTADRATKRFTENVGRVGFFTYKTHGKDKPKDKDPKIADPQGGTVWATTAQEMFCNGFIWFPDQKWQPVFFEEVAVIKRLSRSDAYLVDKAREMFGQYPIHHLPHYTR